MLDIINYHLNYALSFVKRRHHYLTCNSPIDGVTNQKNHTYLARGNR